MAWHNKVGEVGERLAKEYLQQQNYKIVEQNFENKFGEIDLIVKDGQQLVFVEVRTKTGAEFGRPEQTIGQRKKRKLQQNVKHYLKYSEYNGPHRIDVIGVLLDKQYNKKDLRHFRNITGY